MEKHTAIGGMIAGGFDPTGKFLLTVSHSGRGVFETGTWQRVARDSESAYPEGGAVPGIGPIAGVPVAVHEIDYDTEVLKFSPPDGRSSLRYSEGTLTISSQGEAPKNA